MKLTGNLTWDRVERVSDRYGSFNVYVDEVPKEPHPAHKKSRVVATVKATRKSEHIGDFFRGIYPSTPDVGEVVDLGVALVDVSFEQDDDTGQHFGRVTMTPEDGREVDWIDPRKLYHLHSQTVEVSIDLV